MTIDTLGALNPSRPLDRQSGTVSGFTPGKVRSDTAGTPTPIALKDAPSLDQVNRAVSELNQSQQARSQGLEFSVDSDTQRTVVKVIDQSTKEVLRQIPTPEALEIAKALEAKSTKGVLIQQTA
jgi:flagellar protein FlaG